MLLFLSRLMVVDDDDDGQFFHAPESAGSHLTGAEVPLLGLVEAFADGGGPA